MVSMARFFHITEQECGDVTKFYKVVGPYDRCKYGMI